MNSRLKTLIAAAGLAGATLLPLAAAQADSFSLSIGGGPGYYEPYYGPRYYAAPAYYGYAPPPPVYYGPRYGYWGGPRWHGGGYYGHGYGHGWHGGDRGGWHGGGHGGWHHR